jgi:UDP-N-acetylmuramate dehydrogenase
VSTVKKRLEKINIEGSLRFDEPMHRHTTFQVGGPADVYVVPASPADVATVLQLAEESDTPLFTLGGGSNVLVSDAGIRGIVMDMGRFDNLAADNAELTAGAGLAISDVTAFAADRGLGGIDFLYSMPGSVGGAVWMNARCYGSSIIDILSFVRSVAPDGTLYEGAPDRSQYDYKLSPYQSNGHVLLEARFRLKPEPPEQIWERMRGYEADRSSKGHFSAPSAGSVFKNNRSFGSPSGAIIDSIGLRGTQIGGARISDNHANIIVNTGSATASDIRALIEYVEDEVKRRLGYELEREVLLAGDWEAQHVSDPR